jgi:excisionase family DNA binding protein
MMSLSIALTSFLLGRGRVNDGGSAPCEPLPKLVVKMSEALLRVLIGDLVKDEMTLDLLADALAPRLRALGLSEAPDEDRLMRTEDAARYLSCSKRRLYDLVMIRKLEPQRDGRSLLFRRSELDRYAAGDDISARSLRQAA